MANIDATLKQNIFYLPKRQRIADVHHNHEADHFGRAVEITEWIAHCRRLRNAIHRLKRVLSDKALRDDPAHKARLAKRLLTLEVLIEQAYEAIHPKPPTKKELEFDRRIWRAERDG